MNELKRVETECSPRGSLLECNGKRICLTDLRFSRAPAEDIQRFAIEAGITEEAFPEFAKQFRPLLEDYLKPTK